jgi:glycogen debranching enzyme
LGAAENLDIDDAALSREAQSIITGNDRGGYTVPTAGLYPYQWNWDSAIVAMGFAAFDLDRAWTEIETLVAHQWPDGMIPHIVFHKEAPTYFPGPNVWDTGRPVPTSGHSQPPVAAFCAEELLARDNGPLGQARAARVFDALMRWHRWWHDYRDPGGLGIVAVTHPWESGRDNSPDWDDALQAVDGSNVAPYERRDLKHVDAKMRPTKEEYDRYIALVEFGRSLGWNARDIGQRNPFFVADPGTTFILLAADRALLRMASLLKKIDDIPVIEEWIARTEKGIDRLWDASQETFAALDLRTSKHGGGVSNAAMMCFFADVGNDDQRAAMIGHYRRIRAKTRYGVASHDPDQPNFNSIRYWRGPVWAFMNMMIGKGLSDQGYDIESRQVWDDTRSLLSGYGFAEYFDCNDGSPAGGGAFSWTAATWLQYAADGAPWAPQNKE